MTKRKSKLLIISILVIIIVVVGVFIFNKNYVIIKKSTIPPVIKTLPSNSNTGTKSLNSQNNNSTKTQTSTTSQPSSNQQNTISSSPSQWTSSQSGQIILKEPVSGSTVSSGFLIAGSSSLNKIYYNLIDNQTGQISTNVINVTNGIFSSHINFGNVTSGARLDVYGTLSNGKEISIIEIPLQLN